MKILVIAPHPDDETLGCGGTLFRHKEEGDEIYWLIVTEISEENGWKKNAVIKRNNEIIAVSKKYQFSDVFHLRLPTTKIDTLRMSDLIVKITDVLGREVNGDEKGVMLLYIYNDGSTERVFVKE